MLTFPLFGIWQVQQDNSNQTMGSESSQETSWMHNRYQYLHTTQLPQFGRVQVFRKRTENYDYVGVLRRAAKKDHLRELQSELCFLTGKNSSLPFLKIFYVGKGSENLHQVLLPPRRSHNSCWEGQGEENISIHMELLTYSLQQHLEFKRQAKQEITIKQYSYIIKTALSAAMLYEQWALQYLQLDITSDLIFLKPNGQIKLLPFRSRYLKEEPQCGECLNTDCMPSQTHREFQTYSLSSQKKKSEGKYLRQLKNLSLQLFTTINPKIDAYVRTIPNFNRNVLLSLHHLEALKALQCAIVASKTLRDIYEALREVEDDFLIIQCAQSSAEVEISNPQTYQAFIQHLATLNSFQKPKEMPVVHRHQKVSRNIFEDFGDSESNTHSDLAEQPTLSALPSFSHFQ